MNLLHGRKGKDNHAPEALSGFLGPDAVEVTATDVCIDERNWCRSFAITGYPSEVSPGWLEPLLTYPGAIDVSLYIEPIPAVVAADRLRRQLARMESTRRIDESKGRLGNPEVEAAADDARDLASRLARGEGRLFRLGIYVTVSAANRAALDEEVEKVRALLGSLLLDARPTTFRALAGWISGLPLGLDLLGVHRSFDTQALAAAFPFVSADLSSSGGVLYGINLRSQGLVLWDRFAQPNHNAVTLARSGAGKSYHTKLELLRSLYSGIEAMVIDPEDEYSRLSEAVGGTYLHLGAPGVRLNPFDLGGEQDALVRRGMFAHTLISSLLGAPLDPDASAALDRAVVAAYEARGITSDARTHNRPAPVLVDVVDALLQDGSDSAVALGRRLEPFTTGTHRQLFDGPTTTAPEGHLVVFSLRDLPDELKAAGTLLVLDALWRRIADPSRRRRRIVVVDEAWLVMRDPQGARFLFRMAKSARKYWAGLSVVTQDAGDLLSSELGRAVVANAATQVLLRQAPQTVEVLAESFRLSEGEQSFLLSADRGEGILVANGTERVAFKGVASTFEHKLVTTDPAELTEDES